MNSDSGLKHRSLYTVVSIIVLVILAILFAFPLYWIITGAFKTNASINATTPDWFPKEWVLDNFRKLFSKQSAPLWDLYGWPCSAGSDPLAGQYRVYGCDGNDPYLYHIGHGRICACQETFPGPGNAFYPDRLCDGAAQAGNSDSVTAGNVVLILV